MTDYTKPKEKKFIKLGVNKTKVQMNTAGKKLHKENILKNIKQLVLETKADHVGQAYNKSDYDKCYSAPRFVLADPNAPSSLKDLAYRVTVVSTETEYVPIAGEVHDLNEDYLIEKSNRGANYRAAGASEDEMATHKADVQTGKDWVAKRPASHQNIVDHYNRATPNEKAFGHSWYSDAHELTGHVARDTKTPMHTAAGIVANHSPQNGWAQNIHDAARVMRGKKGIGGKGEGIFASNVQKTNDDRMLAGEHYDHVLKGHKIKAFGHLIEHGGNADHNTPHVVIDRHAAAVAHGDRITDNAYKHGLGGLKSPSLYKSYENHYHKAAAVINASHPDHPSVHAHQVQAVTWLVRQRDNQAMEQSKSKSGGSGTAKRMEKSTKDWSNYAGEHHPHVKDIRKMSGYSN